MATKKHRLAIEDDDGTHLRVAYVESVGNDFDGADFSGLGAPYIQNLRGRSFRNAILYWANLDHADLSACNLDSADLRGSSLRGTKLVGANLRGAQLCRDNLGGPTSLHGADLSSANLDGADLTGAEYDLFTIFPRGFDPHKAGCILVTES